MRGAPAPAALALAFLAAPAAAQSEEEVREACLEGADVDFEECMELISGRDEDGNPNWFSWRFEDANKFGRALALADWNHGKPLCDSVQYTAQQAVPSGLLSRSPLALPRQVFVYWADFKLDTSFIDGIDGMTFPDQEIENARTPTVDIVVIRRNVLGAAGKSESGREDFWFRTLMHEMTHVAGYADELEARM